MYDICIIGSGPGGYVCAIRAAQLGLKVALIEKESTLGGVCLNRGCIPTKALLHCSKTVRSLKYASEIGVEIGKFSVNLEKMVEYSRKVVDQLTSGVAMLMKKNKIDVISGTAEFVSKNKIKVLSKDGEKTIDAKNFVVAVGATARKIPGVEFDEQDICSAKGAMLRKKLPESLVIIGGGVIGIEFASFYSGIGSKVTVLEAVKDILMTEDHDIRKKMNDILKKDGITVNTNSFVKKIEKSGKKVNIEFEKDGKIEKISSDMVIIAIGIVPNSDSVKPDLVQIKRDKWNFIEIDDHCKTNIDNIYAIGDVTNKTPWLAHKASHEGIFVAEEIAAKLKNQKSHSHKINYLNVPSCIYSYPQVASIGLTEEKALEKGLKIKIGNFAAVGNGKALASHDTNAFVKTIFDEKTGEILGCHIISHDASEMIHSIGIAKSSELTDLDLINNIFAHPTVSEMIHESVLSANKRSIHS